LKYRNGLTFATGTAVEVYGTLAATDSSHATWECYLYKGTIMEHFVGQTSHPATGGTETPLKLCNATGLDVDTYKIMLQVQADNGDSTPNHLSISSIHYLPALNETAPDIDNIRYISASSSLFQYSKDWRDTTLMSGRIVKQTTSPSATIAFTFEGKFQLMALTLFK
jgi:hypothetical protein